MQTWAITDPGNIREQNQDAYAVVSFGRERTLLIVCDGMGGARAGNVASSLAAEVFSEEVRRSQKQGMNREAVDAMLKSALQLANQAVYDQSQLSEEFHGMGTTLVAAYVVKDDVTVINVGDSRAYHFSSHGVDLITRDHSIVAYMVERGELTQEQAKTHPGKNVITRAVGTEESVEGDLYHLTVRHDDCLMLCSDGLSNEMADQEMLFEVAHGVRRSDCCKRLLSIAKNRGAPDNVTVVLAQC